MLKKTIPIYVFLVVTDRVGDPEATLAEGGSTDGDDKLKIISTFLNFQLGVSTSPIIQATSNLSAYSQNAQTSTPSNSLPLKKDKALFKDLETFIDQWSLALSKIIPIGLQAVEIGFTNLFGTPDWRPNTDPILIKLPTSLIAENSETLKLLGSTKGMKIWNLENNVQENTENIITWKKINLLERNSDFDQWFWDEWSRQSLNKGYLTLISNNGSRRTELNTHLNLADNVRKSTPLLNHTNQAPKSIDLGVNCETTIGNNN